MQTNDSELFSAWAAGDTRAGDALVQRHYARVRRMVASKVADHVEDLTQSIFLAILEAHPRFRKESSFSTFLFSIVRHKLFQHYRAQTARGRDVPLGEYAAVDLGPSASSVVARKSAHFILLLALNEIPIDSQIALELYYWEEMSASQIAPVLGLKEGGVRSRIRRAISQLREALAALPSGAIPGSAPGTDTEDLDTWAESLRGPFKDLAKLMGSRR